MVLAAWIDSEVTQSAVFVGGRLMRDRVPFTALILDCECVCVEGIEIWRE